MKLFCAFIVVLSVLVFTSCTGNAGGADVSADSVCMKYAEHISIVRHDGYSVVELDNPWKKGEVLHRYVLVARSDSGRVGHLPEGTLVYVPVERSVVLTSPHANMLCAIGASDRISGVCDAKYINNETVARGLDEGVIIDCGDAMSPMVEKMTAAEPQVLMASPFENAGYGKLEKMGVPIVECADYMETSALGRAEWIKFYGMLFGMERQADSVFNVVDSCYACLKKLAAKSQVSRSVVTERKTGSVWYCPGGSSSMGKLIADANGQYVFADDKSSGSLSLSPEYVLDRAGNADVWMFVDGGKYPIDKKGLLAEYSGYSQLKAFEKNEIYVCNSLGTTYFDDLSFRPDYVLRDLIAILHPDVMPEDSMKYYVKMAEGMY